jgi:hypothetical protein
MVLSVQKENKRLDIARSLSRPGDEEKPEFISSKADESLMHFRRDRP